MRIKRLITILAIVLIILAMLPVTVFAFWSSDESSGCYQQLELIKGSYHLTSDYLGSFEALEGVPEGSDPNAITMTLDGNIIYSDVPPFIEKGRTMVPVRFVSDALGAEANWNGETGIVTVDAADGRTISMKHGDKNMLITKGDSISVVTMDVTTIIKEGRTFIPVRFIAEALGLTVDWYGPTRTVIFTTETSGKNDSLRFKEEYEALNDEKNADGSAVYSFLTVPEDNNVVYLSFDELDDFMDNKSGLLYFGRPGCPWCRLLIPYMLDYAKEDSVYVYYYNIEQDRTENNLRYKAILAKLGEYLPVDTVTQSESDADFNPDLKRVVLPHLFFFSHGEVVAEINMYQHEFLRDSKAELVKNILRERYNPIVSAADHTICTGGCE